MIFTNRKRYKIAGNLIEVAPFLPNILTATTTPLGECSCLLRTEDYLIKKWSIK